MKLETGKLYKTLVGIQAIECLIPKGTIVMVTYTVDKYNQYDRVVELMFGLGKTARFCFPISLTERKFEIIP